MKAIILMNKCPLKEKPKSRLAKDIGQLMATELYKFMILQSAIAVNSVQSRLDTDKNSKLGIINYYLGSDSMCNLLPADTVSILQPTGLYTHDHGLDLPVDLGQKMMYGFQVAMSMGYTDIVTIGTDIINISSLEIIEAFEELEQNDLVLGPTYDGGYYLIGMTSRSLNKRIFEGINWSTHTVLQETIDIAKNINMSYSLLRTLIDIDTQQDIKLATDLLPEAHIAKIHLNSLFSKEAGDRDI